ncbi:MAG: DUF1850 domain-containing protein [Marinobacter sp.]|uniref:DUF1850 domain-containing protein n=1 Tax=Marinobacter sp. TaxID=50741 RepID=UPI0034A08198
MMSVTGTAKSAVDSSSAQPADTSTSTRLEVISAKGVALVDIPLRPGERWCLAWNHSVTGIQVLDCYRFHEGRMMLERSHQPDFAAGLGHIPGRGVQVSDGEGGYWIEDIDEPVPGNRYLLRVGSKDVNHRIVWHDKVTSLSASVAGERVTIQLSSNSK